MNGKLTLLELNILIRNALQDSFPGTIWVVAEISEMKVNRSGHCYLELVEKDGEDDTIVARARATIWSYSFRMIRSYFETTTGQVFSEGIKVLVQAAVEYHPSYGLSLNIRDIDPTYTLGDLFRRRREVIRQLEDAGVINMNRELPLPLVPQRIAVISSATAAGYRDFTDQLEKNAYGFHFTHRLFEAPMQGSEAVPGILTALDRIYSKESEYDAVAIIRGGGAQADLSCFDSFDLAFAVAQFPLPVITGIGHEKDDTILDMVAHTRQKTPTAAAEFFIAGAARFYDKLRELEKSFVQTLHMILENRNDELEELANRFTRASGIFIRTSLLYMQKSGQRLFSGVNRFIFDHKQLLVRRKYNLSQATSRFFRQNLNHVNRAAMEIRFAVNIGLKKEEMKTSRLIESLRRNARSMLSEAAGKTAAREESIRLLDPRNVLKRGFTVTRQNGIVLKSVRAVSEIPNLETLFADGSTESKIIKISTHDDQKSHVPGCDE